MPTTTSIVTAVNQSNWNNLLADDGTETRVRQGQTAVLTAFGNLSIPAGSTINGIELLGEGYATSTGFSEAVFSVSNDGGSTFSTEQAITTAPWVTSLDGTIEEAGGPSELWGMTWDATTAAAIQVQIKVDTVGGAVYFDYLNVRITYTPGGLKPLTINGSLTLNGQLTIK